MNNGNNQQIAVLVFKLGLIFQEFHLDESVISVYTEALKELDIDNLRAAVDKYIKTGHVFPKPADLIELSAVR